MPEDTASPEESADNFRREEMARILREDVQFMWNHPQDHWGELSRN